MNSNKSNRYEKKNLLCRHSPFLHHTQTSIRHLPDARTISSADSSILKISPPVSFLFFLCIPPLRIIIFIVCKWIVLNIHLHKLIILPFRSVLQHIQKQILQLALGHALHEGFELAFSFFPQPFLFQFQPLRDNTFPLPAEKP